MGVLGSKILIRCLAGINVVLLLALTFYVSHLLVIEYLDTIQGFNLCWFVWMISAPLFFVFITLQITADVFLFVSNSSSGLGITQMQTLRNWNQISTLFLTFLTLGLLLSLFCDQVLANPMLTSIAFIEILARMLTMISVQKFLGAVEQREADNSSGLDPYLRYISTSHVIHCQEKSAEGQPVKYPMVLNV